MSTQYTNSVSYMYQNQFMDAQMLGWVDSVLRGASFLSLLPIVPSSHFMREEYYQRKQGTTKQTQTRKLNEEPPAKSFNPFEKKVEYTALYDRRTDIDKKLAKERPESYDQMLFSDAEYLFMDVDYDIINGVPDNTGYGMRGLADRIPVSNTGQDVNNGGATLNINASAANFKTFLRLFRKAKDKVKRAAGTTVMAFCNETVEQAVSSGRDELGANVVGVGTIDILSERVLSIDNVPLIKVRGDSIGNEILPFTEGSSSTSIWLVSVSGPLEGSNRIPNGVTILSSRDEFLTRYDQTTLTQIQTMQEVEVGLRVPDRSVSRLSLLLTT